MMNLVMKKLLLCFLLLLPASSTLHAIQQKNDFSISFTIGGGGGLRLNLRDWAAVELLGQRSSDVSGRWVLANIFILIQEREV